MEALDERAVRDRREQVTRELRLLVVPHPHVEGVRHPSDTPPLGRPTRPGSVEVADIDRASNDEVAAAGSRELALASTDRYAGCVADVPHRAQVVVPAARLLEPDEADVVDETCELDRLLRSPRLVGVDSKNELVATGLPGGPHPQGIRARVEPAHLELHAAEPEG